MIRRKTASKWLLFVLLAYMFGAPLIRASTHFPFMQAITTVLLIGVVGGLSYSRRYLLIGIALAVPGIVFSWADLNFPNDALLLMGTAFTTAALLYIAYLTIAHLWAQRRVDGEMLRLAVIGYLLMGAAWVGMYALVVVFDPTSIAGLPMDPARSGQLNLDRARGALTYFSFVTMTTLGYGDIAPKSELARSLAMLQALVGQAYIAFVVAKLVALYLVNNPEDGR